MNFNRNLKNLSGDASFRKFYRNNKKKNSIIVFAKKEKKSNLLIYDAINQILLKNRIKAPKLIKEKYNQNYIEIEDLGNNTIFNKLSNNNKIYYYYKVVSLLKKLQKITDKKINTFNNLKYTIPKYTKKKLFNESKLFLDWYVPKKIRKKEQRYIIKTLKNIFLDLLGKLEIKKKVFVHRDFHISNMILYKKKIYLIDSQDAVYGNIAYDLASLIDDVRYKTTKKEKNKIFDKYVSLSKSINVNKLKNDLEILSVMRNIKIIGIFTRLSERDGKNKYLKLVPRAWNLIEQRINKNHKFKNLKYILDKYFPQKKRKST